MSLKRGPKRRPNSPVYIHENQISGKVYTVEARSVIIIFMTLGKLTVTDCDGRGKRPRHNQAAVPNV